MRAGLALAHARGGRLTEAQVTLDKIEFDKLIDVTTHHDRMSNMALVAETLSYLPDHPQAERVCAELAALLRALGHIEEAAHAFELAAAANRDLGAPALVAQSEIELVAALLATGSSIDDPEIRSLLAAVTQVADELGLTMLHRRRVNLLGQGRPVATASALASRRTWPSG
jgi:hypothetical protein